MINKITPSHIYLTPAHRMKVKLAAQVSLYQEVCYSRHIEE